MRRLIRSALFAKINTLLVIIYYKIVYDQALIHFALIGDISSKGDTMYQHHHKVSKLDLDRLILTLEILFCSHNIRVVIESSNIYRANLYANAFLRKPSYAPGHAGCVCS